MSSHCEVYCWSRSGAALTLTQALTQAHAGLPWSGVRASHYSVHVTARLCAVCTV